MKLKYSGESSRKFWRIISNVKDTETKERLTDLGKQLQELEFSILKELNELYKKEVE